MKNNLLAKAQQEWLKLKLELALGKLKNVHEAKKKRKEIARIKTELRKKELTTK